MSVDRILNVTWWRDEAGIELNGRHLFFDVNNQVCLIIPLPPNFGLSWRLSGPLLLEAFLGQVINCRGNALLTIAGKLRAKAWHWILRLIARWPGFDSQTMQTIFPHLHPVKYVEHVSILTWSAVNLKFYLHDGMTVMLSKQLHGQLFVQIYSEVKSASGEDGSRVENIYPL